MSVPQLRRGLPRVAGGDAWPPGDGPAPVRGAADVAPAVAETIAAPVVAAPAVTAPVEAPIAAAVSTEPVSAVPAAVATAPAINTSHLRAGLPRVAGGAPWPSGAAIAAPAPAAVSIAPAAVSAAPAATPLVEAPAVAPVTAAVVDPVVSATSIEGLRRGLPRVAGGAPWPSEGIRVAAVSAAPVVAPPVAEAVATPVEAPVEVAPVAAAVSEAQAPAAPETAPAPAAPKVSLKDRISALPLLSKILWGSAAFLVVAGVAILLARLLVATPALQSFIETYPGETHLPETAPVGLPAWLGWQHFFNVFLMVLIIRSGITIRREQRPTAYFTPRRAGGHKVSLTIWFHQSLDLLWLINGVVFVVLLFITGQWMRIVPTSWEVIPNAVSAGLQYLTLDWPTENGWVNYNSLQVLAYFTTVFLAAPLAAITGFRMSAAWPANWKKLNAVYPMEWARAIHFPVMIYFCAFIVIHVFLVFTTGALRNLNHIYAAQDVVDWTGFWIFVGSMVLVGGAWAAARPLVIAPIARLFGSVTSR